MVNDSMRYFNSMMYEEGITKKIMLSLWLCRLVEVWKSANLSVIGDTYLVFIVLQQVRCIHKPLSRKRWGSNTYVVSVVSCKSLLSVVCDWA